MRDQNNNKIVSLLRTLKNEVVPEQSESHLSIDHSNNLEIDKICKDAEKGNSILLILFGRDEISITSCIREKLKSLTHTSTDKDKTDSDSASKNNPLEQIRCWSVRPSDILPEEILLVIRQYLRHWWNNTNNKSTLHIYLDDMAQFRQYPILDKEENFLPALFSICNEVRYEREFNKPLVIHDVKLHLICTGKEHSLLNHAEQLENCGTNS